jgi:hypothetical protein
VLLLLAEDYGSYPRFLEHGVLSLCCEYQQPYMDATEISLQIVRTVLHGLVIYDPALGK